jgi:septal ring factor EnvC (AmiA/AmiB activator)
MNTETFDPAKILNDAKNKVVKEKYNRTWREIYLLEGFPTLISLLEQAAFFAIASVREECEKDVECLKGNINRMEKEWREINHKYAEHLEEIERLKAENERKDEALREARVSIATTISSIQYHHAPKEYGMIECSKLAEKAISESEVIQIIDKALNPTK